MALLVYVTERCREDAQNHGLSLEIERFRARVEETQSTSLFDPFPPPYLVKKKLGGRQGRLISERRTIGEHAVIVFLAILIRGNRAYEAEFAVDPISYGKQHLSFVTDNELQSFVRERTETAPPPNKTQPTESEYAVLYSAFSHHEDSAEDLVCETKEWVEDVSQDRISKQLALLCKPCLDALSKDSGLHFVPVSGKQGWGVWALRSPGRLLLLMPATETNAADAEARAKKIAAQLEGKDAATMLRASRRAYPALMLADDELWIDLEKEPVGNMALSPEESEVLESARRSEHPFPLFINGRAGSGKSTILQYLFADLLFFHLTRPEGRSMESPIYLTANGELLRLARNFVERLLRSEAIFASQINSDLVSENRSVLDEVFREFQPHLLSLIPTEGRSQFSRTARIDYTRFRRMWMERFGKDPRAFREFGPDLSWHIIRSYVKGMSSETFLEPEDYGQLPQNQITVTHEAFKAVYERVWLGWYQRILEIENLWDDQDLTRYVLDNDLAQPVYSAVFCDEAQDFTRLELELLLRLNLFSDRSLQPNDIHRVPFAFAGDQFQTLNPTGFRWDAIKASFVEKFIFELDPARYSGRVDLNYRELKYNYRSTHRIVRFGNHIQAMRAALFRLPDLKPQIPWTLEPQSLPVVSFHADDANFWKKFRDNPGFVVIVPCGDGEEADFVSKDPILREQIRTEDGVPVNVLSAGRAKGCEYPAVVVYGFGSAAETDLISEMEANERTSDPDRSLPVQYFVNRLYVAVSRPKRRLIIVDTPDGFKKLWRGLQDESLEEQMLAGIKHGRAVWGHQIEGMTVGKPEDLTRENAGDPLENAKAFEAEGLARQDAFLLKQAAQAYRSAGELAKARECRARAFEADASWYEAGEAYFEAGFAVPDSVRCFWHAGKDGWNRLVEKLPHNLRMQAELECEWARIIVEKPGPARVADLLDRFANRLNDLPFAEACVADIIWREALASVLQPLTSSKPPVPEGDELWMRMAMALDRIRGKRIRIPSVSAAQVYFWAKRYPDAIGLWDEVTERPAAYHKAKASVAPYPERILSVASLGSNQEIIDSYLTSPEILLSPEQASAVSDAFRQNGNAEQAFDVAWNAGVATPILRLVHTSLRKRDLVGSQKYLHAGLSLLVRHAQWEPIIKFVSSDEFIPSPEWKEKDLRALVQQQGSALRITLVRALARSESLSEAPPNVQQRVWKFLRTFLRVKDASWRAELSIAEAGTALERGGRFTDTISFYEAVEKDNSFAPEDRLFARQRWVVNKQHQMEHERSQGALAKASQIEQDIRQEMAALRLTTLEDVKPFPKLPALEFPVQQTSEVKPTKIPEESTSVLPMGTAGFVHANSRDPLVVVAGPLNFEFSRKLQRCNIKHSETMETAFIKLKDMQCGGEVEFNKVAGVGWACASWKLVVQLPKSQGDRLVIDVEDSGVQLRLLP